MSYRIALRGVDLATYELAVGDVVDTAGRKAVVVHGHARTKDMIELLVVIDDTFTSWIDIETGRPLRYFVDEVAYRGKEKERTDARLYERAGDTVPIDFRVGDGPLVPEPQRVSGRDVWDYNAFVIALRSWDAPPGSTISADVLRSRFLWKVEMTMRGQEWVRTDIGEFPAVRLDGRTYRLTRDGKRDTSSEMRELSLWISNDADRVPLRTTARTDYGEVEMTLVEYVPGNGRRLRDAAATSGPPGPST